MRGTPASHSASDACDWHPFPLGSGEAALAYPLVLAADGRPQRLPIWEAQVRHWLYPPRGLCPRRGAPPRRGIMTLRNPKGVIAVVFFFAIEAEAGSAPTLLVPFLRLVEPAGGRHALAAALRAVDALAREEGCVGLLLLAEPASPPWADIAAGLEAIGRRQGFVRRGEDWFRPLDATARVVVLPPRRHEHHRPWETAPGIG